MKTDLVSRWALDAPPLQEKERISLLLRPRAVAPLLLQALEGKDFQPGTPFRGECKVRDFKYEPGEYCSVLYQLNNRWVIGFIKWPLEEQAHERHTKWIPALSMQVYAFPEEPALPMLTSALDPEVVKNALSAALPEIQSGETRIIQCRVTPIRFRPGKRCTLRIELWLRETGTGHLRPLVLYGKVYHKLDKAQSVYKEMQLLSDSRAAREGRVILAPPRVMIEDLAMVVQGSVDGDLLETVLTCRTAGCEPRAEQGLQLAAAALSAVHHSGIKAGRERPIATELVRFQHRGRNIGRVNPALAESIVSCAQALASRLDDLEEWGAELTIVHGDCKPSQFLTSPGGTAILDFDHVGMADPAVDVGTFLATLRQMACRQAYRTRGKDRTCFAPAKDLEELFLSAYCEAGEVHPGFRNRAIWYESAGLVRKAIRAFERSPFSGLPMALVAEAETILEMLPASQPYASSQTSRGSLTL